MPSSLPESAESGTTDRGLRNRPEAELLLACTAAAWDEARLHEAFARITAGLDWELVIDAALRHGVMPLVCRALLPAWTSHLPASALSRIQRESRGHALRSLHLANELVRLCRMLEQNGVRALALKGPALAASVYGSVTLRQFTDLDLLVPKDDLATALALFQGDGYRAAMPGAFRGTQPMRVRGAHEITLSKEKSLFTLDLHWRLSPPYFPVTPEGEELWQRGIEVELGNGRVFTLGPEDLMLYLCAHGAKHGWQSLGGVCDVAMAASRWQYNWDALVESATAYGGLRTLLLGALLAHDMAGAAIPEQIIMMARAERSVTRSARVFSHYFFRLDGNGPGLAQRWLIPIAMMSDRAARFRYAVARAFFPADADWQFLRLSETLFPLYFALRPLRLAWQKGLNRAA